MVLFDKSGQQVFGSNSSTKAATSTEETKKPSFTGMPTNTGAFTLSPEDAAKESKDTGPLTLTDSAKALEDVETGKVTAESEREAQAAQTTSIKPPTVEGLEAYYELLGKTSGAVGTFSKQLKESTKSYERAFNELKGIVGEQGDAFKAQLQQLATGGKLVDIAQPGLKAEVEAAAAQGQTDFSNILNKYVVDTEKTGGRLQFDDTQQKVEGQDVQPYQGMNYEQIVNEKIKESGKSHLSAEEYKDIQEQAKLEMDRTSTEADETPQQQQENISNEVPVNTDPNQGFYVNDYPEVETPMSVKVSTALDSATQLDANSINATLEQYGVDTQNMNSSEMLQVMLLQQGLTTADDPTVENYLTKQTASAAATYATAVDAYSNKISEIDAIVSGKDIVPTSYEALSAKIYKQQTDLQMESVEAEKKYAKEQQDVWMSKEREKRGRLEGYLKAKLYSMGAEDASAGLSMMALSLNAADLNIQLKNAEYNYSMSRLNSQGREIMIGYTNSIAELGMKAESSKSSAAESYRTQLSEIEGRQIENEMEKKQLRLETVQKFTEKMQSIDADKKAQEKWEYEKQYQQMRDTVDDSYKLSGMMGSYYAVGSDGRVVDTGIKTFDTKQWESSNYLAQQKFQHSIQQDAFTKATKMVDLYGSSAAPMIEVALGMPEGSISGMETVDEQKAGIENWFSAGNYSNTQTTSINQYNGLMGVSSLGNAFEDGKPGGQCGTFVRTKYFDLPPMGNDLTQKIQRMDNVINNPLASNEPEIGDMLISDVGTKAGHVMIAIGKNPDGSVVIKESNWNGDEIIGTRTLQPNQLNNIVAIHRGDLKPEFDEMLQREGAYMQYSDKAGFDGAMGVGVDMLGNLLMGAAEDNPFLRTQVKKQQQEYQETVDPMLESMYTAYAQGDEAMESTYKSMSDVDKRAFDSGYWNFRASHQDTFENSTADQAADTIMNPSSFATLKDYPIAQRGEIAAKLAQKKENAMSSGDIQGVMAASAGSRALSQDLQNKFTSIEKVTGQLEDIATLLSDVNSETGIAFREVMEANPYSEKGREAKAKMIATLPELARGVFGEKGVLTDADMERYQKVLPELGDTEAVQEAVMVGLLTSLQRNIDTEVKIGAMSGYDLSGFTPMYNEMQTRIDGVRSIYNPEPDDLDLALDELFN